MSFGVYRKGATFAHGLDPRAKIFAALAYLVGAFCVTSWAGLAVAAVAASAMAAASGVGVRDCLRALRPFAFLMAFVFVFDVLFVNSGDVLVQAGIVCVSTGGIAFALTSVVRFACVLLATSMLMRTTSPTELSDGAFLLLSPLRALGLKTDDAALALGMTFRFIPVLVEEFDQVKAAQEARLARFDGGVAARLRAYGPVIVPLFVRALRRSEQLALAVANREYAASDVRRTSFRAYRMAVRDTLVVVVFAALMVAGIAF